MNEINNLGAAPNKQLQSHLEKPHLLGQQTAPEQVESCVGALPADAATITGKDPVPALDAFRSQAMSTQIHAYIMSMIDGKRTIEDMAKILEQQKLMTRDEAIPAIRNFMTRMYDDSQRSAGF